MIAIVFAAALVASACDVRVSDKGVSVDVAKGKVTDEWSRSYTIASGGRLEIVNVNGDIEVTPADGSTVEVEATRDARAGSDDAARELLRQVQIVEQVAPDHVKVEVRSEAQGNRLGRSRVSVEYRVRIPAGLTASFHTQNGAVRLDNINGRIDAVSTNGGITGRGLKGSVTASTVNGGVQLAIASLTGDVDARVVNGGIRIELPPTLDAVLDATTVNGSVSVDDALPLAANDRARQHVSGRINKGGPKIGAQTTNGGVRVMARAAS
jgi:DUF4097 and DUF4098 domain-containing protein YvlB